MTRQKQEIPLSFKITAAMKTAIDHECEQEHRSQSDMSKVLIAEALVIRQAKRNTYKLL